MRHGPPGILHGSPPPSWQPEEPVDPRSHLESRLSSLGTGHWAHTGKRHANRLGTRGSPERLGKWVGTALFLEPTQGGGT
jgi:hypothetical protein